MAVVALFIMSMANVSRLSENVVHTAPGEFPELNRTDTIWAGQTYITNLPDSLSGLFVVEYTGISLPAKSWLIKQSFFWKTSIRDRGSYEFQFRALLEDDSVDSVGIRVTVK